MTVCLLIDVAPDPVGMGIVAVLIFVIAFVFFLLGGFVFFLWHRKRSVRTVQMIHPEGTAITSDDIQLSNPNQT